MINVFFSGHGYWLEVTGDPNDPDVDMITPEQFTSGVFCLGFNDEMVYRHTKCLAGITYLLPCTNHSDSHFSRIINAGYKEDKCTFNIDKSHPMILDIAEPDKLHAKTIVTETERSTMLRLIIGMAIDAYKYDPGKPKNSATGNNNRSIKVALENLGLSADEKTISKYLKEAADLYPDARPRKT